MAKDKGQGAMGDRRNSHPGNRRSDIVKNVGIFALRGGFK